MKKFTYHGVTPMSFGLNNQGETIDFILIPGESYELPAENDHIKTLIAKGFLVEVSEAKKETKTDKNK